MKNCCGPPDTTLVNVNVKGPVAPKTSVPTVVHWFKGSARLVLCSR